MIKWIKQLFKKKQPEKKRLQVTERIRIIVFTENRFEEERIFKLFHFMFLNRTDQVIYSTGRKEITTNEFNFVFLRKAQNARGYRAHYVLNLTQDIEFNNLIARPTERLSFDSLKDPKWQHLF